MASVNGEQLMRFWAEVVAQPPPDKVTREHVESFLLALEISLAGRETPLDAGDARLIGHGAGRLRDLWRKTDPQAAP